MTQPNTNATFVNSNYANVAGVDAAQNVTLTIEFLSADPTLVAGVFRAWYNTTTFTLKIANGTVVKSIALT